LGADSVLNKVDERLTGKACNWILVTSAFADYGKHLDLFLKQVILLLVAVFEEVED